MGVIMIEEERHALLDERCRCATGQLEPAPQQRARAFTGQVTHQAYLDRRSPQADQRVVERRRQVGRGIDQRPVEIEDDDVERARRHQSVPWASATNHSTKAFLPTVSDCDLSWVR